MPSLTVPFNIWIAATRDERDAMFLNAGFNPDVVTHDNGTTPEAVRFRQGPLPGAAPGDDRMTAAMVDVPLPPAAGGIQSGDDTRDFQNVSLTGDNPVLDEMGIPVAGTAIAIAGRALRLIMGGGGGRLTAALWNSLPSLARSALVQVGIGVGALIAFNGDIPFITLPGQGTAVAPIDAQQEGGGAIATTGNQVDIQIGSGPLVPHHFVGSWVANGVRFYRLVDGKLAVQNKKGRWKIWRPKRPIVLYADGASNLKTMLRADKALNKQAKHIASMLNRRAPRRKPAEKPKETIIVEAHSRQVA